MMYVAETALCLSEYLSVLARTVSTYICICVSTVVAVSTSDPINLAVLITWPRRLLYASAAQRMNANDIFSLNCSRRPSPWDPDVEPSDQYCQSLMVTVSLPSWPRDAVATNYSTEQHVRPAVWSLAGAVAMDTEKLSSCVFGIVIFLSAVKAFSPSLSSFHNAVRCTKCGQKNCYFQGKPSIFASEFFMVIRNICFVVFFLNLKFCSVSLATSNDNSFSLHNVHGTIYYFMCFIWRTQHFKYAPSSYSDFGMQPSNRSENVFHVYGFRHFNIWPL